jgi:transposase
MNKALPKIKETSEELREMLKNEPQSKRQNRLQALYLIVTRQAKSRSKVAEMLGKNRNTISDWMSLYEAEGLEKLLEIYKPSGAKAKISEPIIEEIKAILGSEKGFRTYKEIHQMVVKKHKIDIHYSNVHQLVRYKLEAKARSAATE